MPNYSWKIRHQDAWTAPRGAERPIVALIKAWLDYAAEHARQFESGIGDDGVLGEEWKDIGCGIRGLLNGELGRLDGGELDRIISQALQEQGFDPDRC